MAYRPQRPDTFKSQAGELSGIDALARMLSEGRALATSRPQQRMRETSAAEIPSYGQMSPKEQQEQTMAILSLLGPAALDEFGARMAPKAIGLTAPGRGRAMGSSIEESAPLRNAPRAYEEYRPPPRSFSRDIEEAEKTIAADYRAGRDAPRHFPNLEERPPTYRLMEQAYVPSGEPIAPRQIYEQVADPRFAARGGSQGGDRGLDMFGIDFPRTLRGDMRPAKVPGHGVGVSQRYLEQTSLGQPGPPTKIMKAEDMAEALSAGARTGVYEPHPLKSEMPTRVQPFSEMKTKVEMPLPRGTTTRERPGGGGGGGTGGDPIAAHLKMIQDEMESASVMRGGQPTEMWQPEPVTDVSASPMQTAAPNAKGSLLDEFDRLPRDLRLAILSTLGAGAAGAGALAVGGAQAGNRVAPAIPPPRAVAAPRALPVSPDDPRLMTQTSTSPWTLRKHRPQDLPRYFRLP